jgi:plastocyanin
MRRAPNNLRYGVPMLVASFVIFAVLLFGGVQLVKTAPTVSAGGGPATIGAAGQPVSVTLAAKELHFDKSQIAVAAGAELTVTFDNQDAGVSHNLAVYPSARQTTPGDRIAGLDTFAGPAKMDLKFTVPTKPGKYFYRCDVHPDTMTGQLAVQ